MENEAIGVMKALGLSSVWFLDADAGVGQTRRVRMRDIPKIPRVGGGGTDFRPPFKWVQDQELEPACLIYLTDMDCRRYPVDPGYPVLWAKIGTWPTQPPPFGDVIEID